MISSRQDRSLASGSPARARTAENTPDRERTGEPDTAVRLDRAGLTAEAAVLRRLEADFSYDEAFSRNIGWVTHWEQQALRRKRVAIAGMGGVGGVHLLTLARLGIGAFNIADFDRFELGNFNRQIGAFRSSIGRPKVEVLAEMASDINPEADIRKFADGVTVENLDAFLDGVDLFIDGLDFFVLDVRARVFARCAERGIPAITAAPIGMGTAFLVFMPGGMSFEQYFRLQGRSVAERTLNFLIGLTPRGFQRSYLMDPWRVNFAAEQGPSTAIACQLCAGAAAAEALKVLLRRGKVRAAPRYHQFDAYRGKWTIGWLPGGNRNPLQRLRRAFARQALKRLARNPTPSALPAGAPVIERIVDMARWAPSGDNAQPWRFTAHGGDRLSVAIAKHEPSDVYDYDEGRPTLLSAGFLLESLRIAATRFGRRMTWQHRRAEDGATVLDVQFAREPGLREDPLLPMLAARSVDRRAYRMTKLSADQKAQLAAALGDQFAIRWFERAPERWQMARLSARATDIRLRIPETFRVHQAILDWRRDFSPDGVPVAAVGLNPLAVQAMRLLMKRWPAMDFANRYLGSTLLSRLELDLVPGVNCAAHFAVTRRAGPEPTDRIRATLEAGQALQRFWLTATELGLVLQPGLATICFALYGEQDAPFTADAAIRRKARRLADALAAVIPEGPRPLLFLGRIGVPRARQIRARSVRRPVAELMHSEP